MSSSTPLPLAPVAPYSRGELPAGVVLEGKYEVVGPLGAGGMARVYRGRQLSLGRAVAIKVLHPLLAQDPAFVRRFEAEAAALAALNHPNIITILDRGVSGGNYFLVMELIEGEPLDSLFSSSGLDAVQWPAVIDACSAALSYIHGRGMIHLDVKPSNLLVDRDGVVKLGDFGISQLTRGGAVASEASAQGTRHYRAPEQAAGYAIDHRADIYSLGVTFYRMMTGGYPTDGGRGICAANPLLPAPVEDVIVRALATDPGARYPDVAEFCKALRAALTPKRRDTREGGSGSTAVVSRLATSTTTGALMGLDLLTPSPIPPTPTRPVTAKPIPAAPMAASRLAGLTPLPLAPGSHPTPGGVVAAEAPSPESKTPSGAAHPRVRAEAKPEPPPRPPSSPAVERERRSARRFQVLSIAALVLGLGLAALVGWMALGGRQLAAQDAPPAPSADPAPIEIKPEPMPHPVGVAMDYALTIRLPEGFYEYRFFEESRGWFADPENPQRMTAGAFENSLFRVPGGAIGAGGARFDHPEVNDATGEVTFRVHGVEEPSDIYVRGSFNNWLQDAEYRLTPVGRSEGV